jgi:uncharacterized membrane protein HdeD (DUF308 family)
MTANRQPAAGESPAEIRANANWLMFLGVVLIILGIIGLGMEVSLTIGSVLFFGFLMLAAGIFQLVDAFKAAGWKSIVYHILIALLYIAAGTIMIVNPLLSAVWMTIAIASMLIAVGILRIFMGLQLRPLQGWGLAVAAGLASIVLGALILAQWPASGFWVIGLFIAIELIMQGWAMLALAMAAKSGRAAALGKE